MFAALDNKVDLMKQVRTKFTPPINFCKALHVFSTHTVAVLVSKCDAIWPSNTQSITVSTSLLDGFLEDVFPSVSGRHDCFHVLVLLLLEEGLMLWCKARVQCNAMRRGGKIKKQVEVWWKTEEGGLQKNRTT